jgi:hypothetical protein
MAGCYEHDHEPPSTAGQVLTHPLHRLTDIEKLDHALQLVSVEKESVQLYILFSSFIINNPKIILRCATPKAVNRRLPTAADQVRSEII